MSAPNTITRTVRTTPEGVTVYAVLYNGMPVMADTGDKAGAWSMALRNLAMRGK